jgi:serine/threonine-protein phosphatase 2A regulatory subunit B'
LNSLLPENAIPDLFALVETHLFRPIPAFSPPNMFSEVSEIYVVKNWVHVLMAHRILQLLLLDSERLSRLLQPDFTAQLVQQLDTPVPEEQQEIEADLHLLLQNYQGFRRPILRCMLSKLVAYLDGVTHITWSVGPVLRLFLTYFRTLPGPVKQSNFLLFRNVFYPLFATEFAYLFENSLTDLAAFFQSCDTATAFWSLKYIKNHWLRTSTRKQLVMFRQLTVLIPMLPMTLFDKAGPVILRAVAPCITSEHFQVALNAAMFCSSPEFLDLFRAIPDEVANILIGPAMVSTAHWSPEQQEIAEYLVSTLRNFEFASKPTIRARTARSPRRKVRFGWGDVVDIAADSDASLDRECEHEKIRQWLVYADASTPTS